MLVAMKEPATKPQRPPSKNSQMSKMDPEYQPTQAELEEPLGIDATFEELLDALLDVPKDQRTPGRGERLLATIR